jgi:hypothetical protein
MLDNPTPNSEHYTKMALPQKVKVLMTQLRGMTVQEKNKVINALIHQESFQLIQSKQSCRE